MIEYSVNEMGIFWVSFKGNISYDELYKFVQELKNIDSLPDNLIALYDLRGANAKFNPKLLENFALHVNNATKRFQSIRAAIIVNEPDITALSILFKQTKKNRNTVREIFSTVEAGVNWLFMLKNT